MRILGPGRPSQVSGIACSALELAKVSKSLEDRGGSSATITNCFVRHFKDLGIQLQSGAALNFIISNTIVSDRVSAIGLAIGGDHQ
jgi:hypothetical protein